MFTLSIALFALSIISAAFGFLGAAGSGAIVASIVLLMMSGISMLAYWRRRPA